MTQTCAPRCYSSCLPPGFLLFLRTVFSHTVKSLEKLTHPYSRALLAKHPYTRAALVEHPYAPPLLVEHQYTLHCYSSIHTPLHC